MKSKLFVLSLVLVLFFSCKEKEETSNVEKVKTEEKLSLKGTWELKGFYNYVNNEVVDSFSNNTISRQIKMYSDSKVMWCKLLKTDSIEFFGYGSYKYNTGNEGKLIEMLEFGSAFMNEVIRDQQEFTFQLDLQEDSFQQIEIDEDGNKIYSENYVRIE